MAAPKQKTKKNYTVKQVYFTSLTMDGRLSKYCKDKGVKPPAVSLNALNEFLTAHNY